MSLHMYVSVHFASATVRPWRNLNHLTDAEVLLFFLFKLAVISITVFALSLNTISVESPPIAAKSPNCGSAPLVRPAKHSRSSLGGQ